MTQKIETWLPIFPGFYETWFKPDEEPEIDHINEERAKIGLDPIDWDAGDWDYEEYHNGVAKECCDFVFERLREQYPDLVKSLTFQKVNSPAYYNFENDGIDIEIEIDLNKLVDMLVDQMHEENPYSKLFPDYIEDRYTRRDGFIPYYSNQAIDWVDHLIEEKPGHCVGSCLQFLMLALYGIGEDARQAEYYAIEDMYEYCTDHDAHPASVYTKNYEELTTK